MKRGIYGTYAYLLLIEFHSWQHHRTAVAVAGSADADANILPIRPIEQVNALGFLSVVWVCLLICDMFFCFCVFLAGSWGCVIYIYICCEHQAIWEWMGVSWLLDFTLVDESWFVVSSVIWDFVMSKSLIRRWASVSWSIFIVSFWELSRLLWLSSRKGSLDVTRTNP